MAEQTNTVKAFFELVRAGLWDKEARLLPFGEVDYSAIMRLAEEQSVVGIVTAGLEHVSDTTIPKEDLLQFIGSTLQIEERNKAMNGFIRTIVDKMRRADIYTLLVKGQGVAQCYERPLWRSGGDIDLYLSSSNYEKAKSFLLPLASFMEPEDKSRLHLGMNIDSWVVELHGTLHTSISKRMNAVSDEVHRDVFYNGNIRSWNNDGVQVFLPSPDNDVIIIFNHFIIHFYGEGIGLRQICDWCRLLFCYREKLDLRVLESRIKKAGLMTEWKAFASFAVEYLGMPEDAMPFYTKASSYRKKAKRICEVIFETGSFGVNKDNNYRKVNSKLKVNIITFFRRLKEFGRISSIFPMNSFVFFISYAFNRIRFVLINK